MATKWWRENWISPLKWKNKNKTKSKYIGQHAESPNNILRGSSQVQGHRIQWFPFPSVWERLTYIDRTLMRVCQGLVEGGACDCRGEQRSSSQWWETRCNWPSRWRHDRISCPKSDSDAVTEWIVGSQKHTTHLQAVHFAAYTYSDESNFRNKVPRGQYFGFWRIFSIYNDK